MTDKKAKTKRSDRPPADLAAQLKEQRDSFVHTFFKKGAEFTEELLHENERLRNAIADLEADNAALRTQLASDEAIRDLLRKIEDLEHEKSALLSHMHEAEAVSKRFVNRHAQIEEDLLNLANLHVASYHLHSTLRLSLVVRHLKELLAQLVGAQAFAIYVADEVENELVAIASEGVELAKLANVRIGRAEVPDSLAGTLERVFLTGVPQIAEGALTDAPRPIACLSMRVDNRAVGVIVIHSLLPQKEQFVAVDHELFKMLGQHAASALVGAQLYAASDGKLPGVEALQRLLHAEEAR